MFLEVGLGVWSGAGIAWWLIAWRLVSLNMQPRREILTKEEPRAPEFLSIFKPLPLLESAGLEDVEAGLQSFIAQLDEASELLLGVHEKDWPTVAPFVDRMRAHYSQARLRVVLRNEPDEVANPKVAWQKILAPHAKGELWLWSDADIIAPGGFLPSIRREFTRHEPGLLTFPYVVREMPRPPALLDALYVNLELYPGVLLLRALGTVDFALGAGMLFRSSRFAREVDWRQLGTSLADDFALGRHLRPVRLSDTTLVTVADVATWKAAVQHTLRWSKTVWWSRPFGSASRVIVLPLLGWLLDTALHPEAWIGVVAMMQVDVLVAALLCRRVGCPWTVRDLLATEAWSLGRILVWLACWFPWPVVWRGCWWWSSQAKQRMLAHGRH